MTRILSIFLLFFICYVSQAQQEVRLPSDLRQHNLTGFNASLFNPAFSLDWNNPQSISIWTRWQWQNIDADPSTVYLNYTRRLNDRSAAGAAFFQHNTGVFFSTGGVLNYAHSIAFSPLIKLSFGANLFGFQQTLADDRFQTDPLFPLQQVTDDFILQFAPGINLSIENFSFSLASENLLDYNFNSKESNTVASDKIFMGMVSYDFPIAMASDPTAFLRPILYLRTIPELDNQIGFSTLLSTGKYWGQLGYNNFYGISVGGGGTLFNRLSLGALVEFGTSSSLNSKDPSFELIASYFLDKPEKRRKPVNFDFEFEEKPELIVEEEKKEKTEAPEVIASETTKSKTEKVAKQGRELAAQEKALAREKRKDSLEVLKRQKKALVAQQKLNKQKARATEKELVEAEAENKRKQDSIARAKETEALVEANRLKAQKRLDSIKNIKEAQARIEAEHLEQQRKQDAIDQAQIAAAEAAKEQAEQVTPRAGEKYEEVATEDGLEPGYYLIANVFGTKKYFDAFMKDLANKGLQPKAFLRSKNKYNYVYLRRYNTMSEARKARDGKFGGRYDEKTWIFRVVGR